MIIEKVSGGKEDEDEILIYDKVYPLVQNFSKVSSLHN